MANRRLSEVYTAAAYAVEQEVQGELYCCDAIELAAEYGPAGGKAAHKFVWMMQIPLAHAMYSVFYIQKHARKIGLTPREFRVWLLLMMAACCEDV